MSKRRRGSIAGQACGVLERAGWPTRSRIVSRLPFLSRRPVVGIRRGVWLTQIGVANLVMLPLSDCILHPFTNEFRAPPLRWRCDGVKRFQRLVIQLNQYRMHKRTLISLDHI